MRKLLSSPAKMALSDAENLIYQKSLIYIAELSLNLMAVKVTNHPEDFLGWCTELLSICQHKVNRDLLAAEQIKPLEKLQHLLVDGNSVCQLKMLRIAPWPIFVDFIGQQGECHALAERLSLLDFARNISDTTLADMSKNDLLAYAGKHTNQHCYTHYTFDIEWFASTKGAKVFHTLLASQPEDFQKALDYIPLSGTVTPEQYSKFCSAYKSIFSAYKVDKKQGEKAALAPATRLLAMRRPDQFIALTNAKLDILCRGLSIAKFNGFDFDNYWQEMIGTLRTFAWWHQEQPEDEFECEIWRSRAILVDLFLYADQELADNSNFRRLRDKALNKQSRAAISRAKIKLSVEEQVDQALLADDLPEFLLSKRDSIIYSVKQGKSVEQVITLMRTIFG